MAYQLALEESRVRYEKLNALRGSNALEFYENYANRLVRQYAGLFQKTSTRRLFHRNIERLIGAQSLDFVAIDGSCNKDTFTDFSKRLWNSTSKGKSERALSTYCRQLRYIVASYGYRLGLCRVRSGNRLLPTTTT